jgi:hypothetical protein
MSESSPPVRHRSRQANGGNEPNPGASHDAPAAAGPESGSAGGIGHDPHRPVGYGNPPATSQFRQGRSGNPRGRPRGTKNLSTILTDTLYSQISIRERGRVRKVPMIEAILMRLRKDALEGDAKAIDRILRLMQLQATMVPEDRKPHAPAYDPAADKAILAELAGWSAATEIGTDDLALVEDGGPGDIDEAAT